MFELLKAYFQDEEGQTSTEYVLLVAVAAMLVMKFKKNAESGITNVSETVFGKMNETANNAFKE